MTKAEGMAAGLLSDNLMSADTLAMALATKLWPEAMSSDETAPRRKQNLLLSASGVYAKMRLKGLCSGDSKTGYRITEKGRNSAVEKDQETRRPPDRTAAERNARLEKKLREGGGAKMSIAIDGKRLKKLDAMVQSGKADSRTGVIRVLIDEAKTD